MSMNRPITHINVLTDFLPPNVRDNVTPAITDVSDQIDNAYDSLKINKKLPDVLF